MKKQLLAIALSGAALGATLGSMIMAVPASAQTQHKCDDGLVWNAKDQACDDPTAQKSPPARVNPFGALDIARQIDGGIRVAGWAIDPDTTAPITIQVYVDNRFTQSTTANGDRPDLATAYPDSGTAHGYDLVVTGAPGTHTVCVYGVNVGLGQNTQVGCKAMDQIVEYDIESIAYDMSQARILSTSLPTISTLQVTNNSTLIQQPNIYGSGTVTDSSTWSETQGVNVGEKVTFKMNVPICPTGVDLELSINASYEYTKSHTTTYDKTWGWTASVAVEPHATASVVVIVAQSTLAVPYTLTGHYLYQSGLTAPRTVAGTYTGVSSHDLRVTYTSTASSGTKVAPSTATVS